MTANMTIGGISTVISGQGQGALDALIIGLNKQLATNIFLVDYNEHTLGCNEQANAVAYIQLNIGGQRVCGVGISNDIVEASFYGVLSTLNRADFAGQLLAQVESA